MNDMEKKIVDNIRSRMPGTESLSDSELMEATAGSVTRTLAEIDVTCSDAVRELHNAFPIVPVAKWIVGKLSRLIGG